MARPLTTDERLARHSVLHELTLSALDLFDPDRPVDPLLERIAERFGCLAALWLMALPGEVPSLIGAAGLSEASRALSIPKGAPLPYPELARVGLASWELTLRAGSGRGDGMHVLVLWFDNALTPPEEYRPAMDRLLGVLRTMWVHRRLAADLRKSYAELAQAQLALIQRERLVAIGALSAMVAHEVRNPLAVIFNCIAALEKGPSQTAPLTAILSEEANRLNQLVSELLDFARPGEVMLESESLEEIVSGAIAAVRGAQPAMLEAVVQIDVDVARSLPPLMLDARLVRRAVIRRCQAAGERKRGREGEHRGDLREVAHDSDSPRSRLSML